MPHTTITSNETEPEKNVLIFLKRFSVLTSHGILPSASLQLLCDDPAMQRLVPSLVAYIEEEVLNANLTGENPTLVSYLAEWEGFSHITRSLLKKVSLVNSLNILFELQEFESKLLL